MLHEVFGLQEHFVALRRYFFMERGDWADMFVSALYDHVRIILNGVFDHEQIILLLALLDPVSGLACSRKSAKAA
jgi:hypothetical protein